MNTQKFKDWLKDKYDLKSSEVLLRSDMIGLNADRYITDQDEESVMSALEDERVVDAVSAIRTKLDMLGMITFDEFPFAEIRPEARPYVLRALQKEIASGIAKAIGSQTVGSIEYLNKSDLHEILNDILP